MLKRLQQRDIFLYPEPIQSSLQPPNLFNILFNIILPCTNMDRKHWKHLY